MEKAIPRTPKNYIKKNHGSLEIVYWYKVNEKSDFLNFYFYFLT